MRFFDLWFGKPWALLPQKMDEIQAVIDARLAGIPIDLEVFHEAQGRRRRHESLREAYWIQDGVAVLPLYGVLAKRANLLTNTSGGTSIELALRDLKRALDDPEVTAVVLDIDSPGGTVDGVHELSELIYTRRKANGGPKPIVAFANELMASAAYWIGSAADRIVATPTAQVGSIGVRMVHVDRSGMDQQRGIKRTEIFAGKYKTAGTDTRPLDEESREYLQSRVDRFYALFVDAVARNRGVPVAKALVWADGRVLIGDEALQAGMVDAIGNMDSAMAEAKSLATGKPPARKEPQDIQRPKAQGGRKMRRDTPPPTTKTRKDLTTPALDFMDEVRTHRAKHGGTLAEAVRAVAKKNPQLHEAWLAARQHKRPPSEDQARPSTYNAAGDREFMTLVRDHRERTGCTLAEAVRHVVATNPELHEAWLESLGAR